MQNPIASESTTESIFDLIKDRFKDPFLNVFTLSALIWNYPFFIYAFSELSPDTKLALIQNKFNWSSLLGPVLISLFINIVLPLLLFWPHKWAERFKIWVSNARDLEKTKIKNLEIIINEYKEQIERAIHENSQKDKALGALEATKENEKNELKINISERQTEIQDLKRKFSHVIGATASLTELEKAQRLETFKALVREIYTTGCGFSEQYNQDFIEHLKKLGLIRIPIIRPNQPTRIFLSKKGSDAASQLPDV